MRFKDLPLFSSFDFIDPKSLHCSFGNRCTKVSPRVYSWVDLRTGKTIQSKVGTVNAQVFHAVTNDGTEVK